VSAREAFNTLSRYMNHGKPCPRCFQRIERLNTHLDRHGKPICTFMPMSERHRLINERMAARMDEIDPDPT
jgi:hypothetical protein